VQSGSHKGGKVMAVAKTIWIQTVVIHSPCAPPSHLEPNRFPTMNSVTTLMASHSSIIPRAKPTYTERAATTDVLLPAPPPSTQPRYPRRAASHRPSVCECSWSACTPAQPAAVWRWWQLRGGGGSACTSAQPAAVWCRWWWWQGGSGQAEFMVSGSSQAEPWNKPTTATSTSTWGISSHC
jgi:hypothetical protein